MRSARALARGALRRLAGRESEGFIVLPEGALTDGTQRKNVLFFRQFGRFQGGHLKVWHYYNHVAASGTHMPFVDFSADSLWDDSNPWRREGQRVVPVRELTVQPDVYFLGALDWTRIDESHRRESPIPVINLVQNARHADPSDESYTYLENKAVRICIDPAVERAVLATGRVRGPIFTIPDAIDIRCEDEARTAQRVIDVLIVGTKHPETGRQLDGVLASRGIRTQLVDKLVPRLDLLDDMRRAKVTLLLPDRLEGAYLPALEGMALASVVICPDIVGASFCDDGRNCFRPPYEESRLIDAVHRALNMDEPKRQAFIDEGFATVRTFSLEAERDSFLDILRRIDELWRDER